MATDSTVCPHCDGSKLTDPPGDNGPGSLRSVTCGVCKGEGEVTEVAALEYEIHELRAERLLLTARVTQLSAELQIVKPVYTSARWNDPNMRAVIAKAEGEMQRLDVLLGRTARKVA